MGEKGFDFRDAHLLGVPHLPGCRRNPGRGCPQPARPFPFKARISQSTSVSVSCFSCGALAPDIDGPVHRYMDSSPGCWALFGEVLAREYSDYNYASHHRLTVDAYAVQHPGKPSPPSIGSVAVHLHLRCPTAQASTGVRCKCFVERCSRETYAATDPAPDRHLTHRGRGWHW